METETVTAEDVLVLGTDGLWDVVRTVFVVLGRVEVVYCVVLDS